MGFERENQNVSAGDLLGALASGEDIQVSGCTVTGVLDVNRLFDAAEKFETENLSVCPEEDCKVVTLSQSVVFDKCVFEGNVVFGGPWSEPDSVTVHFTKDVIFNSSTFKGQCRFRNACFGGAAGFDGCVIGGVLTFKNAVFKQDAKFRTVECSGYSLFGSAVFEGSARFANTHFGKGANFSEARFLGETDFGGVYSSSRAVPVYDSIYFGRRFYGEDESFWRFVKQSATEAGYYRLAGECFYNERCAGLWHKWLSGGFPSLSVVNKVKRVFSGVRLLPEFVFGRLLFGYGERPVRVLGASVIIILFFAVLFSAKGALDYRAGPTDAGFIEGLYFSTITFTTLGYGDLYPSAVGFWRQLAMIEALTGGCLMALFVVCLAKRFSRG
jgi:hypothetical protein